MSESINQFHMWNSASRGMYTQRNYKQWLSTFEQFIGECEVEKITHDDIIGYFHSIRQRGWSESYISSHMIALRVFWKYLNNTKQSDVPYGLIRTPHYISQSWKPAGADIAEKLIDATQTVESPAKKFRDQTIIAMLYVSGMRVSELVDMRMSDIELADQCAVIVTKKTREKRVVYWDDYTESLLLQYLDQRGQIAQDEFLILSLDRKWLGKKMTTRSVERLISQYREKAGITEQIVPHSFRHGLGRDMARQGVHMRHIQRILGHNNMMSSQVYTQINDEEVHDMYKNVAEKRSLFREKSDLSTV